MPIDQKPTMFAHTFECILDPLSHMNTNKGLGQLTDPRTSSVEGLLYSVNEARTGDSNSITISLVPIKMIKD